jgi:nucleoside-diphosphate-sugar epimerase
MKAFVTGGTGFIGSRLVRRLRERGDDVVALVRSPAKAVELREQGVQLVEGDLSSEQAIRDGVQGCDAVFHVAAVYKVGIPASEREGMWDSNVRGTERVLDAAIEAGVPRIVYVSTIAVFGNTHGEVVDESYARNGDDFLSCYDETKFRSHQVALDRIAKGAPIDQTRTGKLKMLMFPETGFTLVHVDDVADGIVLAHDKGRVGESYVLGGEISKIRTLIEKVAEISGRKAPKRELPAAAMKAAIPIGPLVGKVLGFPPNLRELIRTSDGATYWATDDKARRELGYAPRDMDTGLRQMLATG